MYLPFLKGKVTCRLNDLIDKFYTLFFCHFYKLIDSTWRPKWGRNPTQSFHKILQSSDLCKSNYCFISFQCRVNQSIHLYLIHVWTSTIEVKRSSLNLQVICLQALLLTRCLDDQPKNTYCACKSTESQCDKLISSCFSAGGVHAVCSHPLTAPKSPRFGTKGPTSRMESVKGCI